MGLPHPALSTPLATLLSNAHYVRVIFLRRSLRSGDTQTPPKLLYLLPYLLKNNLVNPVNPV